MSSSFTIALLFAALVASVCQAKVLVQPIGRVAYPGTTVQYSCEGTTAGGDSRPTLHVNDDLVVGLRFPNMQAIQSYESRNFTWTRTPPEDGTTVRWDLSVLANEQNNNTRISCTFDQYISNKAVLVVVNGPPGPPAAPTVQTFNLTALTLTWTAPWPFPVSNYTVTMLNLTSNQITQWTATEERYVLTNEQERGQCDELVFTVEAETDVGSTGPSTNSNTNGFPQSIFNTNVTEPKIELNKTVQGRNAILGIQFEAPDVCHYQRISYVYEIRDWEEKRLLMRNITTSTNKTVSDGIEFNVKYMLNLTMLNEHFESYSVITNFTFETSPTTTTLDIGSRTTSRPSDPLRPSSDPQVPPTEESLIVIAIIPGLLVAFILFPVLFLMSWWLCVCRTQRNRVLRRTLSSKPFVPPMAKNPIYDGAETEIYEFIPVFTGLDSIDFTGPAPPILPPPRRATMDVSISTKHTGDSTENVVTPVTEAQVSIVIPPTTPGSNPAATEADGEQYIVMASSPDAASTPPTASPRYTEPPTLGSQPQLENRKFSCDLPSQTRTEESDDYDRLATL